MSQTRKQVLVIITGGTICMTPSEDSSSSTKALKCSSLENFLRSFPECADPVMPEFDILEWSNLIDSSDITSSALNDIASQIMDNYDSYSGFLVCHGSDTLSYTASCLSFMFDGLTKPVVLIGSMLPVKHVISDAKTNVLVGLLVAAYSNIPEVLVVFGDKIMRGNTTTKIDCESRNAFTSPNFAPLGRIGVRIEVKASVRKTDLNTLVKPTVTTNIALEDVICLTVTPNFNTEILRLLAVHRSKKRMAVVLRLYGNGTAPVNTSDILSAITELRESGALVIVTTQCLQGATDLTVYSNGRELLMCGVIGCGLLTLETIVAKTAYLFAKGYTNEEIRELMGVNLRYELTTENETVKPHDCDTMVALPDNN